MQIRTLGVVELALWAITLPSRGAGERPGIDDLLLLVAFSTFGTAGALIASKRPKNPLGWLMIAASFFAGASVLAPE